MSKVFLMIGLMSAVGEDAGSTILCSAKNCSSFSFLLALFIYLFTFVCPILLQFCFLTEMTAMDFEKMLER